MITKSKAMFTKGKLGLKDKGDSFTIYYIHNRITVSKHIYKSEKIIDEISDFLINIYFEYEWNGKPLTEEQLSILMLVSQKTVHKRCTNIMNRLAKCMKVVTD